MRLRPIRVSQPEWLCIDIHGSNLVSWLVNVDGEGLTRVAFNKIFDVYKR